MRLGKASLPQGRCRDGRRRSNPSSLRPLRRLTRGGGNYDGMAATIAAVARILFCVTLLQHPVLGVLRVRTMAAIAPTPRSAPRAAWAIRPPARPHGRLKSGTGRSPVAAPVGGRLVGHARVIGAIGQLADGLAATEEEVLCAGIADRPAAFGVRELEQGTALSNRDDVLQRLGLRLRLELVDRERVARERGVAAHRRPRHAQHVRGCARLARARDRRGRRLGAPRQAEPVDLADHGVARDATELGRNLARRQALRPQFLELLDPLVGPAHVFPLAGEIHRFMLPSSSVRPTEVQTESLHAVRRSRRPPDIYPLYKLELGYSPPHEMSYSTCTKLQYGRTPTQESADSHRCFPH